MTLPASTGFGMSAADETYTRLRAILASGQFEPGQRLIEPDLSTLLGVSRTPLREALRRLQGDGLVALTGRGAIVSKASHRDIYDLYRYRAVLEGFTAELVATRNAEGELSPSQLSALSKLKSAVEEGADTTATARANLDLHRYIAGLSGNRYAIEALSRVWDIIAISSVANIAEEGWRQAIDQHHSAIVAAIERGDPSAAGLAAREHVEMAAEIHRKHSAGSTGESGHR
jgi:DNA-binding GntR family transcriptional regulator